MKVIYVSWNHINEREWAALARLKYRGSFRRRGYCVYKYNGKIPIHRLH